MARIGLRTPLAVSRTMAIGPIPRRSTARTVTEMTTSTASVNRDWP